MKIGLICPYDIFKNGGVQECVLALKHEYNKAGHEAYIITPKPKGVETEQIDGIILIGQSRDFKSPFHTTAQVSVSFENGVIEKLLQEHDFDILHFHEPWVPIVSRQILAKSNTVNIATFHAKLPETMVSKTIEKVITPYTKSILKYIDSYTAVSEPASEYIQTLTDSSIELIPNGIDIKKFRPKSGTQRDESTILYIGRLEKRKGVLYLLKAFAELQKINDQARLVIAGDGPDRQKLEIFVDDNNIEHVEFLGFVDEATKIELLHSATIFCSPAIYGESFGIVLLEAMSAGTVTVASNNPGYESVLKETGAISIVNVKDTAEFARRLQLMMVDTKMRDLWVKWAKGYVQQFEYAHIAQQYLDVYDKTMKASKK